MIRVTTAEKFKNDSHYIKGPLKKRPLRFLTSQPLVSESTNENEEIMEGDSDSEFAFPLRSLPTLWNLVTQSKITDLSNDTSNAGNSEHTRNLTIDSSLRRTTGFMNLPLMTRLSRLSLNNTSKSTEISVHTINNFRPSVISHSKNVLGSGKRIFMTKSAHVYYGPTLTDLSYNKEKFAANIDDTSKKYTHVQCPFCSKYYVTLTGLSNHIQTHCAVLKRLQQGSPKVNAQRPFSCKFCEKSYVSTFALKMHAQTHTLPYKCPICERGFSRPWLLQGHIRTHTGEKPFSCHFPQCRRSFSDKSNLRAHLQTHAKIKKYACNTCPKSYSRMSLLMKHKTSCG